MKKLCAWFLVIIMLAGTGMPVYGQEETEEPQNAAEVQAEITEIPGTDQITDTPSADQTDKAEEPAADQTKEPQSADADQTEKTQTTTAEGTGTTEAPADTAENVIENKAENAGENAAETGKPKETASKENALEEAVPEEKASEEAVPEETTAEENASEENTSGDKALDDIYQLMLNPEEVTLKEGESCILKVSVSMPRIQSDLDCSYQAESSGAIAFDEETKTITALGAGTGYIHVTAKWTDDNGKLITLNKSCKVTVEKADTDSVILINGQEYAINDSADKSNLQQAVEASGIDAKQVTEIEFKSGAIREDDFRYIAENSDVLQHSLKRFAVSDEAVTAGIPDAAIPQGAFQSEKGYGVLETVYLGNGIRGLDENAFAGCAAIKEFEAPGVVYMKAGALDSIKAQALSFPRLERIEAGAFGTAANPAAELHFPALKTMDAGVLAGFENLQLLELGTVPPEMTGELKLGAGVAENLKLVLPGGAVKYYMKSEYYDADTNTWCNITLPQQEAGEYVITVIADGETVDVIRLSYEEECLGTQLPEGPVKQGYIFLEWNTQADGKGEKVDAETLITEDLTIYAVYREEYVYTVTFVVDDEEVLVKYVKESDNLLTLPKDPVKSGYTFKWWEGVIDGGVWSVTDSIRIHADLTLYARFEKNAVITANAEPEKTEVKKETEEKKEDKKKSEKKEEKKDETAEKAVKTGDDSSVMPLAVTMILAGGAAVAVMVRYRRKPR